MRDEYIEIYDEPEYDSLYYCEYVLKILYIVGMLSIILFVAFIIIMMSLN